jgi:excisionase family DNA binding protein
MSEKQGIGVMSGTVDGIGDSDRLLSVEKAAELLGLSIWTVRKWVLNGKINSAKLGSRRLIPLSELKRFIRDAMTA